MDRKINSSGRRLYSLLVLAVLALAACARQADQLPRVWIDYPRRNLRVAPDQPLLVTSHAYAASGLAEVVLSVDGVAYTRTQAADDGQDFSEFQQEWLPPGEGSFTLQVVAYDSEGARSNPASLNVVVGEPLAVEQPPQPDPEEPPAEDAQEVVVEEPSCPPRVTVQTSANCRSGPGENYTIVSSLPAGAQAAVIGQSQDGYWWVVDLPGGGGSCWIWEELVSVSDENCQVVRVEAPAPPQDLEAPPVPGPVVPADGLSLSCRASQNLAWLPVEDQSGIAGYALKLEKELSPGNWQVVNVWNGIQGKQQAVAVDCGLRYRWAVRAEDGAGNLSAWSAYARFSVELD